MRPTGTAAELENRRRKCFELLDSGKPVGEVAEILGVDRTTVSRWKARVREGGKRALKAIPQYVKQCQLTVEQQKELGRIITNGALAAGYPTDLWTTVRITEVILKRFKIQYNHDHVGRMLHRLGFSCQKPAKQAKEHDEKAARVWRKREWPRIKKGRRIES